MSQVLPRSKRDREPYNTYGDNDFEEANFKLNKIPNTTKCKIYDFHCQVYFKEQIYNFKLSDIFHKARFAVLFFCPYDFTIQSKHDLQQIEENCNRFLEYGAVPIAITHDQAQVHWGYASPGRTPSSLGFSPSFLLASDSTDRLISASFKSLDDDTLEMKRSVVVVDRNMNVIYQQSIPQKRFFPVQSILHCLQ